MCPASRIFNYLDFVLVFTPYVIIISFKLKNFNYGTINVFVENTMDIKRDEELVTWFKDEYSYLDNNPNIEVLYHNTDFGVGD